MEKNQAEAPITPRGMSEVDAARYIGVAPISLRQGRCEGRREKRMPPPPFIKLGRKIIYLKDDLDRWLEMYRVALAIVLIILTSR
jgi:hypothetical protein